MFLLYSFDFIHRECTMFSFSSLWQAMVQLPNTHTTTRKLLKLLSNDFNETRHIHQPKIQQNRKTFCFHKLILYSKHCAASRKLVFLPFIFIYHSPIRSWKSNMVLNNNKKFTFGLKDRVIYEISIISLVCPKLFIVLKEVDFVIEMNSIFFENMIFPPILFKDKSFQLCLNW